METTHPIPLVFRLALGLVLGTSLVACAAATETGSRTPTPVNPANECETFQDCADGLVCRTVDAVTRCVFPTLTASEQSQCGECAYPGNCVGPLCVQPDMTGVSCEFDTGCATNQLCISGYCTDDPRRISCVRDEQCFAGLVCRPDGFCGVPHCESTAECSDTLECVEGACVTPAGACSITAPNFSGVWNTESQLNMREVLSPPVSAVLDAVSGPFRYLSGESETVDTDLPDWVDDIIRSELQNYVSDYLPDWARQIMAAVADLNDILSTWKTQETITFEHVEGGTPEQYTASQRWLAIEFVYNGVHLHASPEDIEGWRFTPSDFNAHAECFDLVFEDHTVNVSVGAVVAWLVNNLTNLVTHGRYATIGAALTPLGDGLCPRIANLAQDAVSLVGHYDVHDIVQNYCTTKWPEITALVDRAIADARISGDAIHLSGSGTIAGPNTIGPGTWTGSIAGRPFSGTFHSYR